MLKSSINHTVYIFNCICLSVHSAWLFCFEWSLFLFTITANSACSTNLFSEISASEHPPPCWPQAAPPQVPEDQGGHRRTHHSPPGEEAGTHPTQVTPPINLCGNLSILQFSLNTIFHGVLNSLLRDSIPQMYLFIEMQYLITLYCGHNRIIQIQVSNFPRSVNENTTPNV